MTSHLPQPALPGRLHALPIPFPLRSNIHVSTAYSKMKNFHLHLAGLQVSKCSTCSAKFPGLKIRTAGANFRKCLRCSQDKQTPKLYSAANNMFCGELILVPWQKKNHTSYSEPVFVLLTISIFVSRK